MKTLQLKEKGRIFSGKAGRKDAQWFMSVDPLAVVFNDFSPYGYVFNNPIFYVDPTGKIPEGWGAGNISLANQFGLFGGSSDTYDSFFGVKSFDLGENGLLLVEEFGPFLFPGQKYKHRKVSKLPITLHYFPYDNPDPFNFVQTITTNFDRIDMQVLDKAGSHDITLNQLKRIDGGEKEGTMDSPEGLYRSKGTDLMGEPYFIFDDAPGRVFVKGEKVYWNAELSLVERHFEHNTPLITLSYGFILKGKKPKIIPLKRVKTPSSFHEEAVNNAIIRMPKY